MLLPWIRFRLRTILIVLSVFVLVLPVAGIQLLRLYESALVRQTETALIAQTAFVAASFRSRFQETVGDTEQHGRPFEAHRHPPGARRLAALDLADADLLPPFPATSPSNRPDPAALAAGSAVTPILRDVQTRADIRVTDHRGVVVAASGAGIGDDLSAAEEVALALGGEAASRLRRLTGGQRPAFAVLVRGAAVQVTVASPVVLDDRLVGTVFASQSPSNILDALHSKRFLLMQATALLFAVVVATAIFTSRTVVRPIRRLVSGAERVARGDAARFDAGRYRTVELAQLAASVAAMAASLQQRTGYVRELARSIGHEFKTPLTAMSGALEVLADHFDDMSAEQRKRFLDNLAGDVARLEKLTTRLMELARADMRDQATGVSTVAGIVAPPDDLDVDIEIALGGGANAILPVDADSLRAVLRSLAENASQHGATRLDIEVSRTAAESVVEVRDDGAGVQPGDAPRIFEPFFTTRREQGGTGLGLAITKALIANAGGTIEHLVPTPSDASRSADDSGAVFRITLPARTQAAGRDQ